MAEFLKKYHIEAEALTPIFIGGGADVDVSKQDYYVDKKENKIYVLNMILFIKYLSKNSLLMKNYENFIEKNILTFNEFLNTNIGKSINVEDLKGKFCKNIIDINNADIRVDEKQTSTNKKKDKVNSFSGFVKDGEGHVYVPGSSIKGAIRTILLKNELQNDKKKNYAEKIVKTISNGTKKNNYYKDIENNYLNILGRTEEIPDAVNDKMSTLYISDSDIIKDELMLCEKKDITKDGNEAKLKSVVYRECLKPNTKIEFDIILKDNIFKIENILNAIKESDVLYHKNYIKKYDNYEYKDLFIPIGGGVGFLSKTFTMEASRDEEGVENVNKMLCINKKYKEKHEFDYKKDGLAPKLRKMAKYNNKLYDMGLLAIKKVVETKTGKEITIPKVFN